MSSLFLFYTFFSYSDARSDQLQSAAASALANLLSFYQPNDQGVFDQVRFSHALQDVRREADAAL